MANNERSKPPEDLSHWIDAAALAEHIASSRERAEREAAEWEAAGRPPIYDPGNDDGGYGPGSYFHRAMQKDD